MDEKELNDWLLYSKDLMLEVIKNSVEELQLSITKKSFYIVQSAYIFLSTNKVKDFISKWNINLNSDYLKIKLKDILKQKEHEIKIFNIPHTP